MTYRFKGHVSVDPATYRNGEEVARALEDDPLRRLEEKISKEEAVKVFKEAVAEVIAAVGAAALAPWPEKNGAYTDIQDTGSGRWLG